MKKNLSKEEKRKKLRGNGRCTCGHWRKDHWLRGGWCKQCGCTWWHPRELG
ncbi:MAG: hypothetical protein Q8P12_00335 [bacterium]|nr:hypothetical protein [bacterium]